MNDATFRRCVRVCGKDYQYDSDFNFYPFAYFNIAECYEGETFSVAREIEKRCRGRFPSAELSGMRIFKRWNGMFEVRVNFTISEEERLAYQREVMHV